MGELIEEIKRNNLKNEINEFLFIDKFKKKVIDEFGFSFLENEQIKKIINNFDKREFKISGFYKKINLAKYIRKIYREIKLLRTNYFKFLITDKFKKIEEIKKKIEV